MSNLHLIFFSEKNEALVVKMRLPLCQKKRKCCFYERVGQGQSTEALLRQEFLGQKNRKHNAKNTKKQVAYTPKGIKNTFIKKRNQTKTIMFSLLKKALIFLTTGSFAVVLAACYGVPVEDMYYKLIKAQTPDGEPIQGLEVVISKNRMPLDTLVTNEMGESQFELMETGSYGYNVTINDVDGPENGGLFESQTLPIDNENYEYQVVMQPKE